MHGICQLWSNYKSEGEEIRVDKIVGGRGRGGREGHRGGEGERRRWGDGEMGEMGEMGRWGDGEMG